MEESPVSLLNPSLEAVIIFAGKHLEEVGYDSETINNTDTLTISKQNRYQLVEESGAELSIVQKEAFQQHLFATELGSSAILFTLEMQSPSDV